VGGDQRSSAPAEAMTAGDRVRSAPLSERTPPTAQEKITTTVRLCANPQQKTKKNRHPSTIARDPKATGTSSCEAGQNSCDVMMEKEITRSGDPNATGLDYESNPSDFNRVSFIVRCGDRFREGRQTGGAVRALRPGYDGFLQADGGLMSVTGHLDGRSPRRGGRWERVRPS